MGIIDRVLYSKTHAINLLTADHREVDGLFAQYEKAEQANRKVALVNDILRALTVHAEVEEQIFYPATRAVLKKDDQDMVDEAYVEHASLKGLILQLNGQNASSPLFKGYVTTLKEYVQHHVKEEEKDYFPKVEKTDLDLEALGAEMKELKDTLMSKLNSAPRQAGVVSIKLPPMKPLEVRSAKVLKRPSKTAA
jgi:hemerythrin superfamily protein